jgi:hypothetical protein
MKKSTLRFVLRGETIRTLSNVALRHVAGGGSSVTEKIENGCPTNVVDDASSHAPCATR